jgi:hypothetical protein
MDIMSTWKENQRPRSELVPDRRVRLGSDPGDKHGSKSPSSLLSQIWVYGNSYEYALVAVVVPLEGPLQDWAESEGISLDWEQLCKDPRTKKHLLDELKTTAKEKKVKRLCEYEQSAVSGFSSFCYLRA